MDETRYRLLFEQLRDGIALMDANGRVIEANDEFLRQAGRSLEALRNLPMWQLFGPALVEMHRARFRALADQGGEADWRLGLRRPDGTELPVEMRARALTLSGRRHVLVSSRDSVERRKTERLLQEQLEHLGVRAAA